MRNRNFTIDFIGQPIKNWGLFDDFYILSTVYTAAINTYSVHKKYMYTRVIDICWLWFMVTLQWEYKESIRSKK